jgi:phosphoglycerate dehydrogenase-like enzyme
MALKFVMLPPQTETTREWGRKLAASLPEVDVVLAETREDAERAITDAEAAFGTLPPDLLARATRLRWLQAPMAAPPAGFYYKELIEHPVRVTNFREIYNDHIATHIMAFVLAFARGLHHYVPSSRGGSGRSRPRTRAWSTCRRRRR